MNTFEVDLDFNEVLANTSEGNRLALQISSGLSIPAAYFSGKDIIGNGLYWPFDDGPRRAITLDDWKASKCLLYDEGAFVHYVPPTDGAREFCQTLAAEGINPVIVSSCYGFSVTLAWEWVHRWELPIADIRTRVRDKGPFYRRSYAAIDNEDRHLTPLVGTCETIPIHMVKDSSVADAPGLCPAHGWDEVLDHLHLSAL